MKVDLRKGIHDYSGKLVREVDGTKVTLRGIFVTALNTPIPNEQLDAAQKSRLYYLSNKCWSKHDPKFTREELDLILKRIGDCPHLTPLVYGRVEEAINGTTS